MILGESGIGFGQTLDIVARGRILICFFYYFLLRSCMQNYKGSISLLRRSVGFSVGVDWMKCGWGGQVWKKPQLGLCQKQ